MVRNEQFGGDGRHNVPVTPSPDGRYLPWWRRLDGAGPWLCRPGGPPSTLPPERKPAWRAACLDYRAAHRWRFSNNEAFDAAAAAVQEVWPRHFPKTAPCRKPSTLWPSRPPFIESGSEAGHARRTTRPNDEIAGSARPFGDAGVERLLARFTLAKSGQSASALPGYFRYRCLWNP